MARIRVGISRCLLGDGVRYDGGHKRDGLLLEVLGDLVEWVPVCPEVECGLPVPREPMRLEGAAESPHLVTVSTGIDLTDRMSSWIRVRMEEPDLMGLCGFVFKSRSPSCGLRGVDVLDARSGRTPVGSGLFAQAFMARFPRVPVEEEGRLRDPGHREVFIGRLLRPSPAEPRPRHRLADRSSMVGPEAGREGESGR